MKQELNIRLNHGFAMAVVVYSPSSSQNLQLQLCLTGSFPHSCSLYRQTRISSWLFLVLLMVNSINVSNNRDDITMVSVKRNR